MRDSGLAPMRQKLGEWLDARVEDFTRSPESRAKFQSWIKDRIAEELSARHNKLPEMMEKRLSRMSDDEMVEFVKSRVADDLQMIRINGAVVGGILGMVLYVLTFAAERMWS